MVPHRAVAVVVESVAQLGREGVHGRIGVVAVLNADHPAVAVRVHLPLQELAVAVVVLAVAHLRGVGAHAGVVIVAVHDAGLDVVARRHPDRGLLLDADDGHVGAVHGRTDEVHRVGGHVGDHQVVLTQRGGRDQQRGVVGEHLVQGVELVRHDGLVRRDPEGAGRVPGLGAVVHVGRQVVPVRVPPWQPEDVQLTRVEHPVLDQLEVLGLPLWRVVDLHDHVRRHVAADVGHGHGELGARGVVDVVLGVVQVHRPVLAADVALPGRRLHARVVEHALAVHADGVPLLAVDQLPRVRPVVGALHHHVALAVRQPRRALEAPQVRIAVLVALLLHDPGAVLAQHEVSVHARGRALVEAVVRIRVVVVRGLLLVVAGTDQQQQRQQQPGMASPVHLRPPTWEPDDTSCWVLSTRTDSLWRGRSS